MSGITFNVNEVYNRAISLKQNGLNIRNLSSRLSMQANQLTGLTLDFQRINLVRSAALKLSYTGNKLINLSAALNKIADSVLYSDRIDAEFVRQTLSDVDAAESSICTVNNSIASGTGSYWNRSLDFIIKGEYSNEFTGIGLAGNVALGFTPIGVIADVRDLIHSVTHINERSFWRNIVAIGLGIIAFVPLVGDLKNVKYLKFSDESGDIVKHLNNVDDVTKGIVKNGNEFISGSRIGFKGVLKGIEVDVPNVRIENITYTKRSDEVKNTLRNAFNNNGKKTFLEEVGKTDDSILRSSGLSVDDILQIRAGQVPDGFQIHHKLPLDDGGDNSISNLVLIRNEPYHKVMTNYQNEVTRALAPGSSINVDWPIPDGMIYSGI